MQTESLPTEEEEYQTTKMTQHILKEAGYHWYEVSNFAKPGYECRHNIGYWKRVDYLGVGLGASSLIDNVRYSIRGIYIRICQFQRTAYTRQPRRSRETSRWKSLCFLGSACGMDFTGMSLRRLLAFRLRQSTVLFRHHPVRLCSIYLYCGCCGGCHCFLWMPRSA